MTSRSLAKVGGFVDTLELQVMLVMSMGSPNCLRSFLWVSDGFSTTVASTISLAPAIPIGSA